MVKFFLFFLSFLLSNANEQWRIIEFVNQCDNEIDVVSIINPDPSQLPPGDPVCYARGAACKQAGPAGRCPCSAAVIKTIPAHSTQHFKETLMYSGGQWKRPSVNYRPEIKGVAAWSEGAPAEFTFIQNMDWYDISMIPPGCTSGHYNRFENDYCFGDAGGPQVSGTHTNFNAGSCLNKGGPISPGKGGLPPQYNGFYCAMPDHFTFEGRTVYPCRQNGQDLWFAGRTPGNCGQVYDNGFAEKALNYIRADAFQCCYKQALALKGSAATPGISASFKIQAMGPNGPISSQCADRECILDFTKNPLQWVTTDGCKKGYQYPFDDFYSTQTCTPPERYSNQLGISAKTYRITYCPNGGPSPPTPPGPTPRPGPGNACSADACQHEQCSSHAPWVCTSGSASWGCAPTPSVWNNAASCNSQCNTNTCSRKEETNEEEIEVDESTVNRLLN